MFSNLQQCAIGPSDHSDNTSIYLSPGQVKLLYTQTFHIRNAVLHVDFLRDVRVKSIIICSTQIPQPETVFVPAIALGVIKLTIQTPEELRILVHMTSIPDPMTSLLVSEKGLSEQAVEMIHSHNQRHRYMFGPTANQVQLFYHSDQC
jgi:hypothetical protein